MYLSPARSAGPHFSGNLPDTGMKGGTDTRSFSYSLYLSLSKSYSLNKKLLSTMLLAYSKACFQFVAGGGTKWICAFHYTMLYAVVH